MTLDILFNWPLGENSARFSLGAPSINDRGHRFRIGIIEKSDKAVVKWLAPGWVSYGETQKLDGFIKKGDIIIVEKQDETTNKPVARISVDSEKEWAAEADGVSSVNQGFNF